MVAVTANGPIRHKMSLAPEQQVPANPVSHILRATVADEHPVASEKPPELKEFRQPLQVQSHLEMLRILVQLGHIQRT